MSDFERRDTATRLLTLQVIQKLLRRADAELRKSALTHFDRVGVREVGEIGEKPIGFVQLTKGAESWQVTDPTAFLAWVEERRPGEVVTHASVRSSYTASVLADCKSQGGVLDRATGEVVIPPGVTVHQGAPSLRSTPSPDAEAVVLAALGPAVVLLGLAEPAELLPAPDEPSEQAEPQGEVA